MGDKNSRSALALTNNRDKTKKKKRLKHRGFHFIHSFKVYIQDDVCVRMPVALCIFLAVSIVYNLGILSMLVWTHALNFRHYTYWNYILVTVFDIIYLTSCFTSPKTLFKWMNLVVFPIVTGSTAIVNILIIVILQNNDWIMVSASVFGEGQLPLGKIHLADYLIHSWPFLARFIILILGQLDIVRHFVYAYLHGNVNIIRVMGNFKTRRLAFFFFWIVSPLTPISIYSSLNNPFVEYPTNFSYAEAVIILLCIAFLFQLITFFSVYTSTERCPFCRAKVQHFVAHVNCSKSEVLRSQSHFGLDIV
jgi:hypothetical protein